MEEFAELSMTAVLSERSSEAAVHCTVLSEG